MEILKLLQERHTTKKYDASRKISDADKVDEILGLREKGMHAQYAVALGYGAADDHNAARPKSRWPAQRIFHKL